MPQPSEPRAASDGTSFNDYLHLLSSRQGSRRASFLRYTFYLYLGSVFLFGGFYYLLFRRNPSAFAFTADIMSAQATTFKLAARRDSLTAEQQIRLLQTLADSLERIPNETPLASRPGLTGNQAVITVGGREYSIARSVHDTSGGAEESPGLIDVRQDAAVLTHLELPPGKLDITPGTVGDLKGQVHELVKYLREQLIRTRDLVMRLPNSVRPQWGYLDFVYFSAITQLTVGYGDILPNTTMVRLLVVIQSLLAVIMLVVVINLVVTGNPPPAQPGTPRAERE